MLDFILDMRFLAGLAVGYLLLGQIIGMIFGAFGSVGGVVSGKKSGGASPTGYPVNEGRW